MKINTSLIWRAILFSVTCFHLFTKSQFFVTYLSSRQSYEQQAFCLIFCFLSCHCFAYWKLLIPGNCWRRILGNHLSRTNVGKSKMLIMETNRIFILCFSLNRRVYNMTCIIWLQLIIMISVNCIFGPFFFSTYFKFWMYIFIRLFLQNIDISEIKKFVDRNMPLYK